MPIRVTLVGHSYVRRLRDYRIGQGDDESRLTVDGTEMQLSYVFQGGVNFKFFNSSGSHKTEIIKSNPEVIVVILGGNGVSSGTDIPLVSAEMRKFHAWLREVCPEAITIASESEPRFDKNPDQRGNNVPESHWCRRNAFNLAVGRMLKKRKCDFVLRTSTYLNHREFYDRFGYHLSDRGNHFYWGLVKETLARAVQKYRLGSKD